jgi:hypothetical protein
MIASFATVKIKLDFTSEALSAKLQSVIPSIDSNDLKLQVEELQALEV